MFYNFDKQPCLSKPWVVVLKHFKDAVLFWTLSPPYSEITNSCLGDYIYVIRRNVDIIINKKENLH